MTNAKLYCFASLMLDFSFFPVFSACVFVLIQCNFTTIPFAFERQFASGVNHILKLFALQESCLFSVALHACSLCSIMPLRHVSYLLYAPGLNSDIGLQ